MKDLNTNKLLQKAILPGIQFHAWIWLFYAEKSSSVFCYIKPNLDYKYTFPIELAIGTKGKQNYEINRKSTCNNNPNLV